MSQYVTGSVSARTSGRWASLPRKMSAGGQELQPWLVKSSTTTGRRLPACASAPATKNMPAMAIARVVRVIRSTIGRETSVLQSLQFVGSGHLAKRRETPAISGGSPSYAVLALRRPAVDAGLA